MASVWNRVRTELRDLLELVLLPGLAAEAVSAPAGSGLARVDWWAQADLSRLRSIPGQGAPGAAAPRMFTLCRVWCGRGWPPQS